MPTYSTNLALNLPNDGEYSGTWGQITNNNVGTLIEQAISGYVTQAITDGADTVITIPLGATGVARNMYIEGTGALSASRNLVVPVNKKMYFFFNNTTGGQSVTVKVSGQTGVLVPALGKAALVCNGTDVVTAENYFGSVDINGGTIDNTPIGLTTPSTGAFTNVTVSGAAVPVNGMYLPAANTVAISTLTTQRWKVDGSGLHTFTAPANDITNLIQLITRGSMINFARSTDGSMVGFVGSRTGTASYSLYNSAGGSSEVEVAGGLLSFYTNGTKIGNATSGGQWTLYEPYNGINALKNAATQDTGSFTGTLTGISNTPQTATFVWDRSGGTVTVNCATGTLQGISNSTSMTITGLPATIQPIRSHRVAVVVIDAGVNVPGSILVSAASGTIVFHTTTAASYAAGTANILSTGFTNSGTKGIHPSLTFTYDLD